jgi:hypothetical protein
MLWGTSAAEYRQRFGPPVEVIATSNGEIQIRGTDTSPVAMAFETGRGLIAAAVIIDLSADIDNCEPTVRELVRRLSSTHAESRVRSTGLEPSPVFCLEIAAGSRAVSVDWTPEFGRIHAALRLGGERGSRLVWIEHVRGARDALASLPLLKLEPR